MATLVYARIIGFKKARWLKAIIFGALAFFLFWEETYSFLTGTILNWSVYGFVNIPAKILAIFFALAVWDAYHTA